MIYAYVRVSTDLQDGEAQKFGINRYCKQHKIKINKWLVETASGGIIVNKRKLGTLVSEIKEGDMIITTELSRLGRNLLDVMTLLNRLLTVNAVVQTIKDNYRLGNDVQSKVMAFAFGLSAEIERQMISQRTKEGIAAAQARGVFIGRPQGAKSKRIKLTGKFREIKSLLNQGVPKVQIARQMNVHRSTLRRSLMDREAV